MTFRIFLARGDVNISFSHIYRTGFYCQYHSFHLSLPSFVRGSVKVYGQWYSHFTMMLYRRSVWYKSEYFRNRTSLVVVREKYSRSHPLFLFFICCRRIGGLSISPNYAGKQTNTSIYYQAICFFYHFLKETETFQLTSTTWVVHRSVLHQHTR